MARALAPLALSLLLVASCLSAAPKKTVTRYDSPDKALFAIVVTIDTDTLGPESSVELRRAEGKFIGRKNFFTRSHGEGLGVLNAQWSLDSKFFVFSMLASGGKSGGKFPTYYYSRIENRIVLLDPMVGKWITDPAFFLQAGDLITVTVHDTLPSGAVADTMTRSVHLSDITRKR